MIDYSKKSYKQKDEDDVRQFLSETLNRPIGDGPLQPLLSDGLLLCELMQHISPNTPVLKKENKGIFGYHDNINQFLICAEKFSIPQAELFQTVDLVEDKSMQSVFSCILAIKRKLAETKSSQLLTKSVSKQTANHNSESTVHKKQQNFPTQQNESKKERVSSFSKLEPKKKNNNNKNNNKSIIAASAIFDGTFTNDHKDNHFKYKSSSSPPSSSWNKKEKKTQGISSSPTTTNTTSSIVNNNVSKYKTNQRKEESKKKPAMITGGNGGGVRSTIKMYDHLASSPPPVETVFMPHRASAQLYFSRSSETTEINERERTHTTNNNLSPLLKVPLSSSSSLIENKQTRETVEENSQKKNSGSNNMMLSVENFQMTPKPSKSTPSVLKTIENHSEMDYKINQAACRRASLKQMGTNPVTVKDDNDKETVYALGRSIGKGQFGEVFGGLNMNTSEYVAIKRIRRNDMDCDDMNEVDVLKHLDSEHIVRYKGYSKDKYFLNIVLEYVEMGSLRTIIKSFGKFPENLAASHTFKILSGLKYLHDKSVIHCDLKAANILITKTGCLKLTDFGVSLCSKMKDDDTGEPSGTPNWMAPEVIKFNRPTEKSDIWSLGCTVVEMLTGKPPYSNMVSFAVLFKIVEDDTLPIPEGISEDTRDFLLHCFQKDPKNRSTAAELMQHKWLRHAFTSTETTTVTNNVKQPQQNPSRDMLSVPKKVLRKEVKNDAVTTSSNNSLSQSQMIYPKQLYAIDNQHHCFTTDKPIKGMKMESCRSCSKLLNEPQSQRCRACYHVYHNSCAKNATKCSKASNHNQKDELYKPVKNLLYSNQREITPERKDTPLKPIYTTKAQPSSNIHQSYLYKKMGVIFQ